MQYSNVPCGDGFTVLLLEVWGLRSVLYLHNDLFGLRVSLNGSLNVLFNLGVEH